MGLDGPIILAPEVRLCPAYVLLILSKCELSSLKYYLHYVSDKGRGTTGRGQRALYFSGFATPQYKSGTVRIVNSQ